MGNCFSRANVGPREQNKNTGKPGSNESDEPAGYVGRSINSVNIDPNAVSSLKGISPNEETRRTGSANRTSRPTSSSEMHITIDEGKNEITTVPNKLLKNKKKKGKRQKADADLNELNTVLKLFQMPEPSTQLVKQMKDNRKKHYETAVKEFRKELRPTIKKQFETKEQRKCLKPFFEKCITICWLMAVQDPPVYVDKNIDKRGEILDTSIYRIYTISGKTIDYIVWPVLYLTEGGNILVKGVAQGQTEMVSENEHMTSAQTTVLTETQTDVTSTKL
ncbi:hypothetical protein MAR_023966 [Mya arenaria]|uniref:Mitochondria-eating protein C-terminal domain-containing protein n=1 Tax=Mya arenaria TaxID=6604 RepID=A0ABY7DRR8_MYAAR|nr:hypothetical protein MAR_023966 [Mya arenaria]